MSRVEAFHILDRRVPDGIPLFASWWWRTLFAGTSLGLVPVLAVAWAFIDVPFGHWMEANWPTLFTRVSGLGSPAAWLLVCASIYLAAAALRARHAARWAFLLLAEIAVAILVCGFIHLLANGFERFMDGSGAPTWSHLIPSVRCATIAAAAWTCRLRWPASRVFGAVTVAMVIAAEIALGTVFLSDAIAGAWIGVVAAVVLPWVWWRVQPDTMPRINRAVPSAP